MHESNSRTLEVCKLSSDGDTVCSTIGRQVGVCLKHLPKSDEGHEFHEGNVPWQRVINSKGTISPRYALGRTILRTAMSVT